MATVGHPARKNEPSDGWNIARLILTEKGAALRVVLVIALPLLALVALVVVPVIVIGPAGFAGLVPVAGAALCGRKYLERRSRRRR